MRLALIFLLISFVIFPLVGKENSNTKKQETPAEEKKEKILDAFLDYPAVKPIYEGCLKKQKDKTLDTSIADCIWKDVDDQTKEQLKAVISSVEKKKDQARTPANNDKSKKDDKDKNETEKKTDKASNLRTDQSRNYEGVYLGTARPYKQDQALLKVEEFLVKRLGESLTGVDPKETKIFDHKRFHDLYRSQVGKNILHALSGYCVESEMFIDPQKNLIPSHFLVSEDEKKIEANRKTNISLLTRFDDKGENEVYKIWQNCVRVVKSICYREMGINGINYGDSKILKENSYSHNRACQVTHYIREHRQNLIITEEIQKQMHEFNKGRSNLILDNRDKDLKVKYYDYGKGEKEEDLSQLTTLSSREFYDAYKGKAKEMSEAFDKKCLEAKDKEECQKYLNVGKEKEEARKELAEFELKRKAMDEKIKNIRSPAEVKQYLMEEGYELNQIDKMIGDSTDEQVIREAIEKHYEKEKNSLIAAINKQLEKSSSKGDEISFDTGNPDISDMDVLNQISKDLKNNGVRYQEMLHFSNIVSSFLSIIVEEQKEGERNTASLFRELEHEKNTDSNRAPADDTLEAGSSNLVDAKEMEKQARAAGVSETKADDGNEDVTGKSGSYLDVKTINKNFMYYGVKGEKEEEATSTASPPPPPTAPSNP